MDEKGYRPSHVWASLRWFVGFLLIGGMGWLVYIAPDMWQFLRADATVLIQGLSVWFEGVKEVLKR